MMRELPAGCQLEDSELVFFEVAPPAVLANEERIYEHTCYIACTHGLRPAGTPGVRTYPLPELAEDQMASWGGRTMTAAEVATWREQGMLLAELRLPVQAMGFIPDASAGRPAHPTGG